MGIWSFWSYFWPLNRPFWSRWYYLKCKIMTFKNFPNITDVSSISYMLTFGGRKFFALFHNLKSRFRLIWPCWRQWHSRKREKTIFKKLPNITYRSSISYMLISRWSKIFFWIWYILRWISTKVNILNTIVPFSKRKNDFTKFSKHNLHKFNVVHVNFGGSKFFFSISWI